MTRVSRRPVLSARHGRVLGVLAAAVVAGSAMAIPAHAATRSPQYKLTLFKQVGQEELNGVTGNGYLIGSGNEPGSPDPDAFLLTPGSTKPQFLPTPGDTGNTSHETFALGVNSAGHVVGYSVQFGTEIQIPLEWLTPSDPVDLLDLPGFKDTGITSAQINGINDAGEMVGYGFNGTQNVGFEIQGSTVTFLPGIPGADPSAGGADFIEPDAINNPAAGQPTVIIGTATNTDGGPAVEWVNDQVKILGALPGGELPSTAQGNSVNSSGVSVGGSTTASDTFQHAVKFTGGNVVDLNAPGEDQNNAEANAINNAGVIVGQGSGGFDGNAFVNQNGKTTDLNTLIASGSGVTLTDAEGINNNGEIVGTAVPNGNGGTAFGFTLTPIAG